MSETLDPMATDVDQHELAQRLLAQAKEQGIETALEAEMDEHLGYENHDVGGRGSGNSPQLPSERRQS